MRTNDRHLVASAIASALHRSQRSIGWLSAQSGIELPALAAKLREEEDFTIVELADIAAALEIAVSSLTPSAGDSER